MSENKGQFLFQVLVWIEYPDGGIEPADNAPIVLANDQFEAMDKGVEIVRDQLRFVNEPGFDDLKFFASISTQWKGRRYP